MLTANMIIAFALANPKLQHFAHMFLAFRLRALLVLVSNQHERAWAPKEMHVTQRCMHQPLPLENFLLHGRALKKGRSRTVHRIMLLILPITSAINTPVGECVPSSPEQSFNTLRSSFTKFRGLLSFSDLKELIPNQLERPKDVEK